MGVRAAIILKPFIVGMIWEYRIIRDRRLIAHAILYYLAWAMFIYWLQHFSPPVTSTSVAFMFATWGVYAVSRYIEYMVIYEYCTNPKMVLEVLSSMAVPPFLLPISWIFEAIALIGRPCGRPI